ncbi:MAG TPA: hypothetical protein VHM90_13845 [Phycisphaerae bacterium]|nr:hypothetical protein [Phycisphaerae bacterium]
MPKPRLANLFAFAVGLLVCLGTMYLSYTKLKQPQILIDWLALIFCGLTTGIIAFFVVWGHFQKSPNTSAPP